VGGLLGAYELSRDKLFLDKARELVDRLMIAFDTCVHVNPECYFACVQPLQSRLPQANRCATGYHQHEASICSQL
jgi:hypothetical protein